MAQDVAAAVDGGRPQAPEAGKAAGRESGRGRPDDGQGARPSQTTRGGLVICAKNVCGAAEVGVNGELSAADAVAQVAQYRAASD